MSLGMPLTARPRRGGRAERPGGGGALVPVAAPLTPIPAPVSAVSQLLDLVDARAWASDAFEGERLLAGLVRLSATDPNGLRTALRDTPNLWPSLAGQRITPLRAGYELLRELSGRAGGTRRAEFHRSRELVLAGGRPVVRSWIELPEVLAAARMTEVAAGLRLAPVPMLVSTPTDLSGALAPAALLDRVTQAERDCRPPWPLDLEQALFRLPRRSFPELARTVSTLRSAAGVRLAHWLATGGPAEPVATVVGELPPVPGPFGPRPAGRRRIALRPAAEEPAGPGGLERLLFDLDPVAAPGVTVTYDAGERVPAVPALLPHHREVMAAWVLTDLDAVLAGPPGRVLPSGRDPGPDAGTALTLLLAYTLGAAEPDTRQSGLDALISLSAAGHLDPDLLGEHLGALLADAVLPLPPITAALTEATRCGAGPAVLATLDVVLPFLTGSPMDGDPAAADLRALAVHVAR